MVAVIQEICPSLIQLIRGLWVLLEAKQLLKGQGLLVVYEQGASLQRVKKLAILNNSQTFFIYPLSPLGLVDKNKSLQSCPTLQPHRWQPTRLRCPWNSPGKNTGVGCHFLLQRMKVKSEREVAQSCPTLRDPMDCSLPGSSVHGIFQARVLEWGAIAFSVFSSILC